MDKFVYEGNLKVYTAKKKDAGHPLFTKEGHPTRYKFRLYCDKDGCNKYVFMKWGGYGYGGATSETGVGMDMRNQCFICLKHQVKK